MPSSFDRGLTPSGPRSLFSLRLGREVRAKQAAAGVFTIDMGFDRTSALCGEQIAIATVEQEGEIRARSSSDGSDCVVVVETFNADGLPFGLDFNVAVMRAA